ncbi:hypothetical protein ACVINI_001447 [Rhizobium beringeri]
MTGTAAGDERHLFRREMPAADALALGPEHHEGLMGAHEAFDAFGDHGFRSVHELLH